jgi:hypothetical protein
LSILPDSGASLEIAPGKLGKDEMARKALFDIIRDELHDLGIMEL